MAMELAGLSARRTIIHLDLDAFYAQVEMKRKGVGPEVPLAVQQWDGLIAVNYAARAKGVTRHMRTAQAKAACPDLVLVHVQTIGSGGTAGADVEGSAERRGNTKACLQRYRQASSHIMRVLSESLGHGAILEKGGLDEVYMDVTPMVEHELKRLRCSGPGEHISEAYSPHEHMPHTRTTATHQSSRSNMAADSMNHPDHLGEDLKEEDHGMHIDYVEPDPHASDHTGQRGNTNQRRAQAGQVLDSADTKQDGPGGAQASVTPTKDVKAQNKTTKAGSKSITLEHVSLSEIAEEVSACTIIEGEGIDLDKEADQRLTVAAMIAKRLRNAVATDPSCGYTCSAGIAPNKLLAKVGSARNKPNKQTLVLPRAVAGLMENIPLGKLRGLGGKLGQQLHDSFQAETAGAVQKVAMDKLQVAVGERAWWVFNIVRGICDEPVKPKGPIKSLNSCKSFAPTTNMAEISMWMALLSEELAERIADDEWEHRRRPKTLGLQYRGGKSAATDRSVRCSMPPHTTAAGPSPTAIAEAALVMFRKLPDAMPCGRLALVATDFFEPPAEGTKSITHFFNTSSTQRAEASQRQPQQQPLHQASKKKQVPAWFAQKQDSTHSIRHEAVDNAHSTQTHVQEPDSKESNQNAPSQQQGKKRKVGGFGTLNNAHVAQALAQNFTRDDTNTKRGKSSVQALPRDIQHPYLQSDKSIRPGATLLSRQLHSLLSAPPATPAAEPTKNDSTVVCDDDGQGGLHPSQGHMCDPSLSTLHTRHEQDTRMKADTAPGSSTQGAELCGNGSEAQQAQHDVLHWDEQPPFSYDLSGSGSDMEEDIQQQQQQQDEHQHVGQHTGSRQANQEAVIDLSVSPLLPQPHATSNTLPGSSHYQTHAKQVVHDICQRCDDIRTDLHEPQGHRHHDGPSQMESVQDVGNQADRVPTNMPEDAAKDSSGYVDEHNRSRAPVAKSNNSHGSHQDDVDVIILDDIDIQEQQRILSQLQANKHNNQQGKKVSKMQASAENGRAGTNKTAVPLNSKKGGHQARQMSIDSMFKRK